MQNDRKIIICAAGSRKATFWPAQEIYLSELWDKLRMPVRGTEAQADYLALKKCDQDNLKDVGGFVAGSLAGGRRKADAITGFPRAVLRTSCAASMGLGAGTACIRRASTGPKRRACAFSCP